VLLKSALSTNESPSIIVGGDAVAIALVVNELITNGNKHRELACPVRPVRVALAIHSGTANISIRNEPAHLPAGFDFAQGKGFGGGLELVAAMLPAKGAQLVIRQHGECRIRQVKLSYFRWISGDTGLRCPP
jgi:two-component sensor histidine kinase